MKVLVVSDNLMTRTQLEDSWSRVGIEILSPKSEETPDIIAVDLAAWDAIASIQAMKDKYPAADVIAFGPHVDGDAFKAAREAGSTRQVARGKVVESVIKKAGVEPSP